VTLEATGPFGYTVRVLPYYAGLADPAELGLQALPRVTSAETDVAPTYAPTY
jgi:starch phosphorylase